MDAWQEDWYDRGIEDQMPAVGESTLLEVKVFHRDTADENGPSPGQTMFRIWVKDEAGNPVHGMRIAFTTEASEGQAYEHINPWGVTDEKGYLEWRHLGIPTRYEMDFEDGTLEITNVKTDLGYEYPRGGVHRGSWRPTCSPGRYSFRIEVTVLRNEEPI